MTTYVTLGELREYLHDPSVLDAVVATSAIEAASREVDAMCGRYFSQDTTTSVRKFWPTNHICCHVDDISTTTGLLVDIDIGGDGTYSQSWTLTTDYFLEPLNGVVDGIAGWPFTEINATLASKFLPMRAAFQYRYPTVRVTAKWGWAAVPAAVKQATLVIAAQLYKMGDAPFGNAGFGEFGVLRVRDNPVALSLLRPFMASAGYAVA